jgi:hypothetical protein
MWLLAMACPLGPAPATAAPPPIFKRYKRMDGRLLYCEAWYDGAVVVEHRGECGERGEATSHACADVDDATAILIKFKKAAEAAEFKPISPSRHAWLIVEFDLAGFSSERNATEFRHKLEDRLNELTGWLGLGYCDGGSIGSGTLEAACPVVDFNIAKKAIARELAETEFAGYSRIYREAR